MFIGAGKSFFCILSCLFIEANMACLRNVKKYFGLSPSSIICILMISFNLDKAQELYILPFLEVVSGSSKFLRCRTTEKLKRCQEDDPENIYFTTAGISAITFSNGVDIKVGSSSSSLLGLSILSGFLMKEFIDFLLI
jgi:hypothetical protein